MKIRFIFTSGIITFILLLVLVGCTKEKNNNSNVVSKGKKGTLYGVIKLYDKYGNTTSDITDVKIDLIDSLKIFKSVQPDASGSFKVDSLSYGSILLKIEKNGFGIVDTLSFYLSKSVDTLTAVKLAEELPFSFNTFSMSFRSNMIYYNRSTTYKTTDSYLVGELICFSNSSDVSLNKCKFYSGTGSYTNVSYINASTNAATSFSLLTFTSYGFKTGDSVYAVCYPIVNAPFTFYNEGNFTIRTCRLGNPSPVSSFILEN